MKQVLFYFCLALCLGSCKDKEKVILDANSILIHGENILHGADSIASYLKQTVGKIESKKTLYEVVANKASTYRYTINQLDSKQGAFTNLEIWNTAKQPPILELQYLAKADGQHEIDSDIAKQRDKFMLMVAAHDVDGLIDRVYAETTVYYNHKPLVKGRSALKEAYSYMLNPNYSLTLSPLHLEPVGASLSYEIGQCSGGYNGKYIIIWQRQDDGVWQVIFDSNI